MSTAATVHASTISSRSVSAVAAAVSAPEVTRTTPPMAAASARVPLPVPPVVFQVPCAITLPPACVTGRCPGAQPESFRRRSPSGRRCPGAPRTQGSTPGSAP